MTKSLIDIAEARQALKSVQSTSTTAYGSTPLRLDIQFFADPPDDDPNPNAGDPPNSDEDELTLADLLKTNPTIKAEYNERVEKAIKKRLKNFDFDPEEARVALREKKEREENGNDEQNQTDSRVTTLTAQNKTLEEKLKEKSVALYAAENEMNPKLMTRLAREQINKLEFDDDFNLDSEELDEITDSLRTEFPDVFTATVVVDDPNNDGSAPPPPVRKTGLNPGGNKKINNPDNNEPDVSQEVAQRLERLKKNGRI